jgi:hypothetical protein
VRPTATEYKQFTETWGWYKVISDLADNKILDFDKVTELPLTKVFTFLLYLKDKDYAEKAQRRLDRQIAKHRKNDADY